MAKSPMAMPYQPRLAANTIMTMRRIEIESVCAGTIKAATAVMATVITTGAPTSPADMAA
jgi:hypothetical protein